jgi:hypothetical protein
MNVWGLSQPQDTWVSSFQSHLGTLSPNMQSPSFALQIFPNDLSFPPSEVPVELPGAIIVDDIRSILTAVHGAVVSALHSYDFFPEVRAAPCLVYQGGQCYSPDYNFYDPDSAISNSAMLYSFDPAVQAQVAGQLETNMMYVCGSDTPSTCEPGQCIHHFVGNCDGAGPDCVCTTGPGGVQDCFVYNAISGATQTGPNVFTLLASLRYAGTTGNATWLQDKMPVLRQMMAFLDARFDDNVGLYNAPGSLQIDVFIRQNYTADSNAASVILCELFADAEEFLGNATGADFYRTRAAIVRAAMNEYLFAASNDHYCTQSDPTPSGGVLQCARDFVDYDANSLAVAAGVPTTVEQANAILARMDSGNCTHAGRATYVSEIYYDAANCVGGNTGDSAVSMGRIAWQDSLARQAVGDAAATQVFTDVILAPLQADLLRRTWLPERFTCQGQDTHNEFYFEYPATVALMLYEVKYGISLQMMQVLVDPIGCTNYDFKLGQLWIGYYNREAFHAQLTDAHSGSRTFVVSNMLPGWCDSCCHLIECDRDIHRSSIGRHCIQRHCRGRWCAHFHCPCWWRSVCRCHVVCGDVDLLSCVLDHPQRALSMRPTALSQLGRRCLSGRNHDKNMPRGHQSSPPRLFRLRPNLLSRYDDLPSPFGFNGLGEVRSFI